MCYKMLNCFRNRLQYVSPFLCTICYWYKKKKKEITVRTIQRKKYGLFPMTVNDLIALLENLNTTSLEITSQLHWFQVMNTKKPREINWLILEFNVVAGRSLYSGTINKK